MTIAGCQRQATPHSSTLLQQTHDALAALAVATDRINYTTLLPDRLHDIPPHQLYDALTAGSHDTLIIAVGWISFYQPDPLPPNQTTPQNSSIPKETMVELLSGSSSCCNSLADSENGVECLGTKLAPQEKPAPEEKKQAVKPPAPSEDPQFVATLETLCSTLMFFVSFGVPHSVWHPTLHLACSAAPSKCLAVSAVTEVGGSVSVRSGSGTASPAGQLEVMFQLAVGSGGCVCLSLAAACCTARKLSLCLGRRMEVKENKARRQSVPGKVGCCCS